MSQINLGLTIWVLWVSLFDRKNVTLVATNGSASIVKHFFNKSGTQVEFNQHINNINITKDNLLKVSTQVMYIFFNKGGFYSESFIMFVISPNTRTKLFSWARILIFFFILNGFNHVKKGPEVALNAQKRH